MALSSKDKDTLFQLRLRNRIDPRTTGCRVAVAHGTDKSVMVSGYTQFAQTDAFVRALALEIYGGSAIREKNAPGDTARANDRVSFKLKVLERSKPKFAVVVSPAAPLWTDPDDSNPERIGTETLLGTVMRVYHREGKFTLVQNSDGYMGYCPTERLAVVSTEEYLRWKNGTQAVTLEVIKAGDTMIPVGARLNYEDGALVLPDGRTVKVPKSKIVVSDPARPGFVASLQKRARQFLDSPYLWGGKSEVGIDCSGFTQTLMLQEGIVVPRDASMQCHVGEIVGYLPGLSDLLPGDVMFFMNKNAYVFHVGIYLGENRYMHSAGATGPTVSSVMKEGENWMSRYHGTFCYARRMHR